MGVDYYTCDVCDDCVHYDYFVLSIDEWYCGTGCCDDDFSNVVEQNNNSSRKMCEHNFCVDCVPNKFIELREKKITNINEIKSIFYEPWLYCCLCKNIKEIDNKIMDENTSRDELIKIINELKK